MLTVLGYPSGVVHLRKSLIVFATFAAVSLAGCSHSSTASPTPDTPHVGSTATATPTVASSKPPTPSVAATTTHATSLDGIMVEGEPMKLPTIKVPAPWVIDATKTKVLVPGSGPTVKEGGTVRLHYIGVNGRTGQTFDESYSTNPARPGSGSPVTFSVEGVVPGFKKGLLGQHVGSRVLIAMPSADGYGDAGNAGAGIQKGDTLIFVVDIVATSLTQPEGDKVPAKDGLPSVSDDLANPKVSIPSGYQAPTQTLAQPIIVGKGDKVGEKDTILVRYQAVSLTSGQVIESTYGKDPQSGPLDKLIPGWRKGLKDQTVGSRVLLVVPGADAYPNGNATPKIDPGEAIVYTVDILFTTPPPAR